MSKRIEEITIKGFRSINYLNINNLSQITLLTGRNNTGKSSILEALRIWASKASMSLLNEILTFREENGLATENGEDAFTAGDLFQLSSLFANFPSFSEGIKPLTISTKTGNVSIRGLWFKEELQDNSIQFKALSDPVDEEAYPGLEITIDGNAKIYPLSRLKKGFPRSYFMRINSSEARFPCEFVSPYGGESTTKLGTLWDKIALSDREKDVVQALQIIEPKITAISMVGDNDSRRTRTAIVKVDGYSHPIPLRSFGDGVNRLFGIILSLVNVPNGMILIDEFENGMHYSVQEDAWKTVFKLAYLLDIQVIATTHSRDTVEAFGKASQENPGMGSLIRMSRREKKTIATKISGDNLLKTLLAEIEVR